MEPELPQPRPDKKKNIIVIVVAIVIMIGVLVASLIAYSGYRERKSQAQKEESARQEQLEKDAALRYAQRQADISRIISYCKEAEERYEALPVNEKAKEVKPDCTVTDTSAVSNPGR